MPKNPKEMTLVEGIMGPFRNGDRRTRIGLLLLTCSSAFTYPAVESVLGADLAVVLLLLATVAGLMAVAPFLVSIWRETLPGLGS